MAFLRGERPFLDDGFFGLADADIALFFLLDEDVLLVFFFGGVAESWAGNPIPCSSSNAARPVAVSRLRILTGFSVPRLRPAAWHDGVVRSGSLSHHLIVCGVRILECEVVDDLSPAPCQFGTKMLQYETIVGVLTKLQNFALYNVWELKVVNTLKS